MIGAVGSTTNLAPFQRGYSSNGQFTFGLTPQNQAALLHSYSALNSSGTACDVGLGIGFNSAQWSVYSLVGGVATKESAPFTLFDTTNGDGFLLSCAHTFGYVIFNISQAQSFVPVYSYSYWNGTAWVALTLNVTPSYASTGYTYATFNPPADWVIGSNGLLSVSQYTIRVLATTAGGQNVTASSLLPARWLCYQPSLASGCTLQVTFTARPYKLDGSEVLAPFFGTASINNAIEASYQISP